MLLSIDYPENGLPVKKCDPTPPHILLTNYSMLEYQLLRPKDSPLFDPPNGQTWRFSSWTKLINIVAPAVLGSQVSTSPETATTRSGQSINLFVLPLAPVYLEEQIFQLSAPLLQLVPRVNLSMLMMSLWRNQNLCQHLKVPLSYPLYRNPVCAS